MNRLWISLIAVCAVTSTAVSQSRPAIQASTSTTRPATGRWHYWTRCDRGYVVAHETGGLWFKANKLLWRYDLKTGEVRGLSPRDNISAITGPNALVPGKDCASVRPLFFAGRVFLPGKGWTEVPTPLGVSRLNLSLLDPKGNLVLKGFIPGRPAPVYQYAGNWQVGVTLPTCKGLLPLADGYLIYGTFSRGEGIPLFYDLQGKPKSACPVGGASFFGRTYRVGDKTYAVFLKNLGSSPELQILYDATSGSLVEKARGDTVGPDLAGRGFLVGVKTPRRAHFQKVKITLPDGSVIQSPLLPGMVRPRLCRDANGHVWLNAYRWNGKRWDLVVPREHHFPLRNTHAAMFPRLVRLDDKPRTWIEKSKPSAPSPHVFAFDSAGKTGWTLELGDKPPYMLNLHRFADGKRKTLVTLPTLSPYRPDFIRDSQGQWWWVGYDKPTVTRRVSGPRYRGVVRLSGLDAHFYPTKRFGSGFPGFLFYGASKRIWRCDGGGWSFWDASGDKFVPGEPWKEFAFAFGPWTLSLVTSRGDLRPLPATGQRQEVSSLRRKKGDSWVPLADPFGRAELLGAAGMIWKDRMLVCSRDVGILEYDATRDRWVLLHSYSTYEAFFDPAGRRMLVCSEHILSYDGDPFGAPLVAAEAREIAEFRKLLKLMDDRKWRVREQATQEMKKVAPRHAKRLRAALGGRQISLEVRTRIEWVLREAGLDKGPPPKLGESLFDQMHPLPELKSQRPQTKGQNR